MRNDARRRFAFGLTIEDTSARLWYHDRDTLVCSTPFDVHINWKELVHVFLALGSAPHADLGFDITMRLVCMDAERRPVYEIDVVDVNGSTRTFRTVCVLTDHSADYVYSRASRVWKVVGLPCPGGTPSDNFFVLKDCWIELDRRREHTSLADLRSRLKGDPRLKHFLTVVTACVVQASTLDKNGINPIHGGRRETKKRKIIHRGGLLGPSTGGIFDPQLGNPAGFRTILDPSSPCRCHYRIVFEEIGTPVTDIKLC
ncbi:hypothetical protein BDP27DRAFT_914540 [Rhodocollybia butyracea]|uniref:Fungal-type protein kinase domain-containing protein n=1 Tax=Rhodocollybia butyracea TaxID=206335 RepID=A0A9P5PKT9_9AGAR|nr:hypothetical protein BDP27DRAFT_914540 [Rhodocollybia butyracea]